MRVVTTPANRTADMSKTPLPHDAGRLNREARARALELVRIAVERL